MSTTNDSIIPFPASGPAPFPDPLARAILDGASVGLGIIDSSGRLAYANAAFGELIGRTHADCAGQHWLAWADPFDQLRLTDSWENFVASPGAFEANLRIAGSGDSTPAVHARIVPVRQPADAVIGFVITLTDLRELPVPAAESRDAETDRSLAVGVFAPSADEPSDAVPQSPIPAQRSARARILVVDDEEAVRLVTAHLLGEFGFDSAPASGGLEALRWLQQDPGMFDALLLDLTMPGLDGPQTLREVQRLQPDLPVLLMSGCSEEEARERCGNARLAGFLQKPFAPEELQTLLRGAVD